jgi:integrase
MSKVSKKAVSSPQRPSQLLARHAVRNVQILRQILSAALTRAVREELTVRNVARMVELPTREPAEVIPWSSAETLAFLEAARPDRSTRLRLADALWMRRGEMLGLRWHDVDFQANELRIRQQLQRIQGELHRGPVKTRAGRRDLPLLGLTKDALRIRHTQQSADWARLGDASADTGLVFTTRTGRPIEPRNLVRSFT